MNRNSENRRFSPGSAFLTGLVVGALSYLVAEWITPKQVASPGDHDVLLAYRLGLIYTPIVGMWLGWLQRSWTRAAIGAIVGVALGLVYMWLCSSRNFLAIMVGFPCLLGGVMAVLVGSNRSAWLGRLGPRLGKGLVAGGVLGAVYMVLLSVVGTMMVTPSTDFNDPTQAYIAIMWRSGPIALGVSSSLFFVLIRWAVGLTRVRLFVLDDVSDSSNRVGTGKPTDSH
jgi:hypothetical protein